MKRPGVTFVAINLLYLAILGAMVHAAAGFGGEGSIVTLVIGVPTLAMVLIALGSGFFPSRHGLPASEVAPASEPATTASWPRGAVVIAWLSGFFVVIFLVGFYTSVLLYTVAYLKLEGKTSWAAATVTAAALWAVLYLSFDYLMGQALFPGIFFGALVPNF